MPYHLETALKNIYVQEATIKWFFKKKNVVISFKRK